MKIITLLIALMVAIPGLFGQEAAKRDSLLIKDLIERIEELEKKAMDKEQETELNKLLKEAQQLGSQEKKEKSDISKKFSSGVRQQQGLNPNISVLGDFFGSFSTQNSDALNEPSDYTHGSNGLHMRSLELSFVAPLDPYTRGKAFLDITPEGVAIEELYMELINLPLNMSLKGGVFFPEFGLLNRHHTHALPQFDRPRAPVNYFGLDGFNGMGAAFNIMLPTFLLADAASFDFSAINIFDNSSYASNKSVNMAYIGHLKNYYDLSDASYFEYTLSAIAGKNNISPSGNNYVGSFGLHYKWEPPGKAKYKSLDLKTEFYYSLFETPLGIIRNKGFYTIAHRKLNSRLWIGGRIGYAEVPGDDGYEWDQTVNVDWWQSEFVFYRIQYQYSSRNNLNYQGNPTTLPSGHTITVQFSWAMGPHKHDAY